MRDVHLRNIDLNLLVPLYALLEEKQVTRAARRSFLSQPAMSRALDRLREMFGDPLLIRSGRTYERTVAGDRVLRSLQSLLPRLEGMVRGEEFDPGRSSEQFRVAMTDHASMILLPALMERLRTTATNVKVETSTWNDRIYQDVAAGRIDTALSAETPPAELDAEVLYEESFICLVCRARYKGTRRFTLKQYLALPHAVVETWAGMQTPVDRPLAQLGLKRTAVLRIPFFVPTILSVARTDLVLTVPRRLGKIAVKMAAVREIEPPREIKGFSYFLAWHPRLAVERAHAWFRDQVRMAARSI